MSSIRRQLSQSNEQESENSRRILMSNCINYQEEAYCSEAAQAKCPIVPDRRFHDMNTHWTTCSIFNDSSKV
jgi:hypothetical protein